MLHALPSVLLIGCSSDRLELMIILCRVLFGLRWPHGLSTGADEGDLSRDLYAMQTVQDSSLRSFASEAEDSEDGRSTSEADHGPHGVRTLLRARTQG